MTEGDFTATFDVVDGWILYELDPAHVDAVSAARVDVFLETAPKQRKNRRALIEMVVESSISAGLGGANAGAIRCDSKGKRGATYASVLLNLIRRDPDRSVDEDLDEIEAFTTAGNEFDERPPAVERVEIAGRSSLRVDARRRAEVDALEGASKPAMIWRVIEYWVPLAGEIGIVKLNFDTPDVAKADPLLVEFEAIAASLHITPSSPAP